ncbi:MAG: DUF1778 domain-containing protein [Thermomicrobiales bacterium]
MVATPRSEKLDLRLTPEDKRKLIAAAELEHRSVSDFVLRSALDRADDTLPDRRYFGLNAEQWEAFMEALDAPPRVIPEVVRLFQTPSVFEVGETE